MGVNTDARQILSSGSAETMPLGFGALSDGLAVAEPPSIQERLRSLALEMTTIARGDGIGGLFDTEFKGVADGLVHAQGAWLGTVDFSEGPDSCVLTLGDGGVRELELTEALDTDTRPVYL